MELIFHENFTEIGKPLDIHMYTYVDYVKKKSSIFFMKFFSNEVNKNVL